MGPGGRCWEARWPGRVGRAQTSVLLSRWGEATGRGQHRRGTDSRAPPRLVAAQYQALSLETGLDGGVLWGPALRVGGGDLGCGAGGMEGRRCDDASDRGRAGSGLWKRVSSVGPGDPAEAGQPTHPGWDGAGGPEACASVLRV